ncbi:hypothetical protein A2Y85_05860 [candidate division WOR-3 bacterium RBG_13_43_14]|uniref:Major facilitator superfamily (MFS) profile domain-containing protein n=1 Tax=candidate division WOR-3 bacterium RBG_13_43_14 TaxID=1802590 RepID=A0A1F4U9B1_UNCW3|nr:MAG: hypothetical protein A2Y85_05860 [candidate division WOR-3 bacterium RBG_13_43_14]
MWRLIKNKNFFIFLSAQTISQFADKLTYIALIGLIGLYPENQTSLLLSLLALFITLPVLVFGPIVGVLVDRWNKRTVMLFCEALRMLCALTIPFLFIYTGSIFLVFVLVFVMFLLNLFFNTARSAIVPNLVARDRILHANSVINVVSRIAMVLGMWIGGMIVDWSGWLGIVMLAGWVIAFLFDGLFFGFSALMLIFLKVDLKKPVKASSLVDRAIIRRVKSYIRNLHIELKQALKVIPHNSDLTFTMVSVLLLFFAGSIIYVIVVPTIQKTLAWGTSGVGSLAAIGAVGLVLSATLVGIFGNRLDLKNLITIAFIVLGAVLFSFPFLKNFWTVAIATFLGGMAISPVFIVQDTLIHHSAEEVIRGRVFSIRDWLYNASFMFFSLLVGMLATFTERNLLFFIFGVLLALLAIIIRILISRDQSASISSNHS